MPLDRNGLEILDRDECLHLLGQAVVGRVAVTSGALPVVLPVTFRLHGERILFRTSRGTKFDAATRNTVVAFEVDGFEPATQTGWSVMATGVAREVVDPAELEAIEHLQLPRWAPNDGDRVVAVPTELISGRRIPNGQDERAGRRTGTKQGEASRVGGTFGPV
jgi:nitroimidazol reductase NimA-like FMN-containing flavoprotein (pyridoxamine 5'-phosphate oxidase superfamily)